MLQQTKNEGFKGTVNILRGHVCYTLGPESYKEVPMHQIIPTFKSLKCVPLNSIPKGGSVESHRRRVNTNANKKTLQIKTKT